MNTVGLPSCPKGNTQTFKLVVNQNGNPIDITGFMFTFIANKNLDGKIAPPVVLSWTQNVPAPDGTTSFVISSAVTSVLEPGAYYFNLDMTDLVGNITTIMAGTWPITPVPGMVGATITGQPPTPGAPPIAANIMYKTDYATGAGAINSNEVDRAMWADTSPANMNTNVYDKNKDGIVDVAASVPWTGITGTPTVFPPDATAELIAHKSTANGYAALDGTGKVPATQLQPYITDAPTDGQLYGRSNSGWIVSSLANYSTAEQWTGKYWLDGKKIYQKTLNIGALPNNSQITVLHNIINISYIVQLSFIVYSPTAGIWATLPWADPGGANDEIGCYASTTQILVSTGMDRTSYNQNYCTLQYTCTDR
jgi:hypothetical protein